MHSFLGEPEGHKFQTNWTMKKILKYAKHQHSYSYDIPQTGVIFCVYKAHPDEEEWWKPNPAPVSSVLSWEYHIGKKLLQPRKLWKCKLQVVCMSTPPHFGTCLSISYLVEQREEANLGEFFPQWQIKDYKNHSGNNNCI